VALFLTMISRQGPGHDDPEYVAVALFFRLLLHRIFGAGFQSPLAHYSSQPYKFNVGLQSLSSARPPFSQLRVSTSAAIGGFVLQLSFHLVSGI
jgi:hypothetical protein